MWLGTKMYVMLDHPDDVATVLGSPHCVEKAEIYRLVSSRLQTDGLVSNQGEYSVHMRVGHHITNPE